MTVPSYDVVREALRKMKEKEAEDIKSIDIEPLVQEVRREIHPDALLKFLENARYKNEFIDILTAPRGVQERVLESLKDEINASQNRSVYTVSEIKSS